MKKYRLIVILFALIFSVESYAFAKSNIVHFSDVLQSVESHYPVIISALQDQEKAKNDLTASKGSFDPVLKSTYYASPHGPYENRFYDTSIEQPTSLWGTRLFLGYRNGQGNFPVYDQKYLTKSDGEIRGGIEIPLLKGGYTDERRTRISSNEKTLELSKYSVELAKIESKRLATYRYYECLANAEKLKISQELLNLAITRDNAILHRVSKGDAAKIEQIDNQRSVAQRQTALISATRAFEKSALELSLFYRNDLNGTPIIVKADQLPLNELSTKIHSKMHESNLDEILKKASIKHPELLRLQTLIDQNELEKTLAKNSILPKLDTELSVSQDLLDKPSSVPKSEYKIALKFELPLFFRSGIGKSNSAISQGLKLNANLELARDRIHMAIQDSILAMKASKNRVLLTQQEVELSTQVEEAERIKFKHGDSNILTVNLREQATVDAKIRNIDALTDYYRTEADFKVASAISNDSDLNLSEIKK